VIIEAAVLQKPTEGPESRTHGLEPTAAVLSTAPENVMQKDLWRQLFELELWSSGFDVRIQKLANVKRPRLAASKG
jgi:hypothetical protein